MALSADTFVSPITLPRSFAPGGYGHAANFEAAPVDRLRGGKGISSKPSGCFDWRLATGVISGLALRGLTQRRAYGSYDDRGGWGGGKGGGRGGMSAEEQRQRTEAKRSRETSQFQAYQRRLLQTGLPPRDEYYWDREERKLFKSAHVSQGINFAKYDDIPVEATGGQGTEQPVQSFQELCEKYQLPEDLTANIERCGYSVPTPVQKYSMPAVFCGSDVMVSAQTGSGKTAAFLVPIIATALKAGSQPLSDQPVCPSAVVLAPTRELCQQIGVEAARLSFKSSVRIANVYGGADAVPQLKQIAEGCDVVIATPGRLADFLERGVLSMERVKFLALDEADRMLDMGFEPQIRQIIDHHNMPQPGTGEDGRQTMMFSATFPQEMQDMALDFLDPSYLWIGVGRVGATTSNVEQRFEDCSMADKFDTLIQKIRGVQSEDGELAKTIVFANQKSIVDDVAWRLSDDGIRAAPIHGGLSQPQRDRALADLKSGRVHVLVATDVAARGLDLPGVDHVVNYELPLNAEDYVHRIGRTGRIGNQGIATSLVGTAESAIKDIVQQMQDAAQEDPNATPVPAWLEEMAYAYRGRGGGRRR